MVNWEEKLKDKNVKVIGYATEGLDYIYEPEHDNWFDCIDELEDWFNHRGLEVPEYAYGSYFMPFSLDIDNIIEDEAQAYDEEDDRIKSMAGDYCRLRAKYGQGFIEGYGHVLEEGRIPFSAKIANEEPNDAINIVDYDDYEYVEVYEL